MREVVQIDYDARRDSPTEVYVEYFASNAGCRDVVKHCMTLPIVTTVQAAIDDYLPIARAEVVTHLNAHFPDCYE